MPERTVPDPEGLIEEVADDAEREGRHADAAAIRAQMPKAPRFGHSDAEGGQYVYRLARFDRHREPSFYLKRRTAYVVHVATTTGRYLYLRDIDGGQVTEPVPSWEFVDTAPADVIHRVEFEWGYDASGTWRLEDDDRPVERAKPKASRGRARVRRRPRK